MGFFIRDCVRCGTNSAFHIVLGETAVNIRHHRHHEVVARCLQCNQMSIYEWSAPSIGQLVAEKSSGNIAEIPHGQLARSPVRIATIALEVSRDIPDRVASLFVEANECRQMGWYDSAGAMFRKTLDVATKHIFATDPRLSEKSPAAALRSRIAALGQMNILDEEMVELADIAALDGNDAAHDEDPYTKEEAEALEALTKDLLDRLFERPARIAAVKAKQIAAGVRKPVQN